MSGVWLGQVLRGIELEVSANACVGVVGVNGAGKSTLLATVAGVVRPDRGTIERPDCVAYLPEGCPLEPKIPIGRWLALGRMLPGWESEVADEMVQQFGLPLAATHLSQGQRVRLGLILTLARRAALYVLDDPFLGLDPVARVTAERWIARRSADAQVVLAAQELGAVDRLCTSLALLHEGKILVDGSIDQWRQRFRALRVVGHVDPSKILGRRLLSVQDSVVLVDDVDNVAELSLSAAGARTEPLPLPLEEIMQALVVVR